MVEDTNPAVQKWTIKIKDSDGDVTECGLSLLLVETGPEACLFGSVVHATDFIPQAPERILTFLNSSFNHSNTLVSSLFAILCWLVESNEAMLATPLTGRCISHTWSISLVES
jgi:hypothetical protein